jgi:hypothetical protein
MRKILKTTEITQTAPVEATKNVPLVDLGSLMLYATQHTTVMPNVAVIRVFKGALTTDELQREVKRIASNPFGLGRKLEMPKVPGARPLWRAQPDPPDVEIKPAADTPEAVSAGVLPRRRSAMTRWSRWASTTSTAAARTSSCPSGVTTRWKSTRTA